MISARLGDLPTADLWLHAASVGDVGAVRPLIDAVRAARPEWRLLLTVQTEGGREVARAQIPEVAVAAPPLDMSPFTRRAVATVEPRLIVCEYLELWPALTAAATAAGVPMLVVDGRVSARSLRVRALLRRAAGRLAGFCAQREEDALGAWRLGVPADRIRVHGNGKHDRTAHAAPAPSESLRAAIGRVDVVIGSLHPDEEAAAVAALAPWLGGGRRALVAPRYPAQTGRIEARLRAAGVACARRSRGGDPAASCVLLDSLGELAAAYALGRAAIVGGTFGRRGGQTLIEPALHGVPIVHGPEVRNVVAEVEALAGRGAELAGDWASALAIAAGRAAPCPAEVAAALRALRGATARNLSALLALADGAAMPGPAWSP